MCIINRINTPTNILTLLNLNVNRIKQVFNIIEELFAFLMYLFTYIKIFLENMA